MFFRIWAIRTKSAGNKFVWINGVWAGYISQNKNIFNLSKILFIKNLEYEISNSSERVVETEAYKLFHDEGHYHIETSPLICRENQWTGFYMIGTSVMKELKNLLNIYDGDMLLKWLTAQNLYSKSIGDSKNVHLLLSRQFHC